MAAKPLICKSVLSNCMLMQNIALIITSFQNLYLNNNHRQFSHHCVKAKGRPKPPIIVSLSNINLNQNKRYSQIINGILKSKFRPYHIQKAADLQFEKNEITMLNKQ